MALFKEDGLEKINAVMDKMRGEGYEFLLRDGKLVGNRPIISFASCELPDEINEHSPHHQLEDFGEVEEVAGSISSLDDYENTVKQGNIFANKESAELVAKRRAAEHLLCQIHAKDNWTPDWRDTQEDKWRFHWVHCDKQVMCVASGTCQIRPDHFYFKSQALALMAIQTLGEENIKLLCGVTD